MLETIVGQQFDDLFIRVELNREFGLHVGFGQDAKVHILIFFHIVCLDLLHDRGYFYLGFHDAEVEIEF